MVAVRSDHVVVRSQRADQPMCDGLLPNMEVAEPADFSNGVCLFSALLETPIKKHLPKEPVKHLT